MPEAPTIAEAGVVGFEASDFNGLVVPAGTLPALVERLNTAIVRIVNEPAMHKHLSERGADLRTMTPTEYGAYRKAEVAKWAKVVKASGSKMD